jgi:rod shape-determining protein MreC
MSVITINYRQNPTFIENAMGFVITPAQRLASDAGRWASGKLSALANLAELERRSTELERLNEQLMTDHWRLSILEKENERLTALLEIDQKYANYPKVGAVIIASDMGNWYNRFTIDKGTDSGLKRNMVVLGTAGLVGLIEETGRNYSKVISLIDTSSSISAKSIRSDDIGFVRGDFELIDQGFVRMERIDIDAQIMLGDEIITSNLSDIFPPGITIGIVKEIHPNPDGLTKFAIVEPVEDFKRLNTVLVIINEPRILE